MHFVTLNAIKIVNFKILFEQLNKIYLTVDIANYFKFQFCKMLNLIMQFLSTSKF